MSMQNSDAQKSEVHEVTDDASTSPASDERQGTSSRPPTGGDVWPAKTDHRERMRTNVAGMSPAEADDLTNAPPGHLDLNANLSKDEPFYPTAVPDTKHKQEQN